ncbi:MAG: 2-oxoacid:acceptor oxidoreductase subunit alpha [Gammaproteobacteria bacterium]|nr:2-oxoacid:acceptor oxidoreductase subunit alpha [Gammaproteobacteria bacterium]MCY4165301.1 2-oxoacid:acceptor oxidoreductase subunit alpha [Gammaproteobacteria bacterium]
MPSNNDFTIRIANVNGTGSASANSLLMKTLFRMGIPVAGKNFFPSNIQGLPTWYEVRASHRGYLARSGSVDIAVAMNAETYQRDLRELSSGGYLLYDSTWPRRDVLRREDVSILAVPLARLCNESFDNARARILMKNIAYVGVLAALLELDLEIIRELLRETFARKKPLLEANQTAIGMGYDYAREHLNCPLPFVARSMDGPGSKIIIDGNTAAALGCVYAGATFGAWYPITPSTSLMDAFRSFCARFRTAEDGTRDYCVIQAEDELAAIGMVLGASWNGARAFTPTSGPGISLMSEFLGYGYYAEIPAVLFDVQRVGPSTGMPTRTQQGDILSSAYASHGDTRHVLLFPSSPKECFELAAAAFDLAERLQTPVIVLSDLDLGMNDWVSEELTWDESYRPDRGKVLGAEELEKAEAFHRYLDVDGDGVPYRTLPGEHPKGAFFTRGSGHNSYGGYTENAGEYQEVVDRLRRKWDYAANIVPAAEIRAAKGAQAGLITIGTGDSACREALDILAGRGVALDYMRIRAFPFGEEVWRFLREHSRLYVVEQNRDAQLRTLLINEAGGRAEQLVQVLHYNGMPLPATAVVSAIEADMTRVQAA